MKQVSFWGVQHGLGVTTNTAAITTSIAKDYHYRILVSQPQWSDYTLEQSFKKSINQYNKNVSSLSGTGLDALLRLARSYKLDRESVKDNSMMIEKDRMDLLTGSEKADLRLFEDSMEYISTIFAKAKEYYQAIFLDLHSGNNSYFIQSAIEQSDLVVVCLNQNIHVLNKYFSGENLPAALQKKPKIILLGQYDKQSKYKIQTIKKLFGTSDPMYPLSYSPQIRDAFNDGDIKGFFSQNRHISKGHTNYDFMKDVRAISKAILTELGFDVTVNELLESGVS
ncbi:hypothetical protein [Bacillus sp. FSL K6-6540]|uniref:hypothetical protein n=1 Tax=Bacillus sp. FSL K6-6540 TaxID=2921512 RepID=UPI0030F9C640